MKRAIVALALVATGCVPMAEPGGATPGSCDASRVTRLVGRPFSASLPEHARRIARARTVRTILPGDAVTMDYRADRLNLHVSTEGFAERFTCG